MENKQIFLEKIKTALNKGWSSNESEKKYWLDLIRETENDNLEAQTLLQDEFKFNENFKKETGVFKNV